MLNKAGANLEKYEVLRIGYATVSELYEMYDAKVDGVGLNQLKLFQKAWVFKQILTSFPNINQKRILSVGEGLDTSAKVLSEKYKADVYVLDKYEKDDCLDRGRRVYNKTIEDLKSENPNVTYIDGLAGSPDQHKVPDSMFDCIYSCSVLEHVPQDDLKRVLLDMDRMLRPGGLQVHAIDFPVDLHVERLQFLKQCFGMFTNPSNLNKLESVNLEQIRANPLTFYETVEIVKRFWFPMKERKDVKFERWTSFNILLKKANQ